MKKFLYLVVFVIASGVIAQAQSLPVIPWNQRLPNLYYYGSNWIDSSMILHPDSARYWISNITQIADYYIGRPCVTDVPMSVIGIAAPAIKEYNCWAVDTSCAPEYFQLYQHEGDSIYFKGETRWDTVTPQYKFGINVVTFPNYAPNLYEAYFEKPIIVHDTFYVGGTTHSNLIYGETEEHPEWILTPAHSKVLYVACSPYSMGYPPGYDPGPTTYNILSNPNYYIVKYFWHLQSYIPTPSLGGLTFDTTTIHRIVPEGANDGYWLFFFAIFDTNFVPGVGTYDDSCLAPTGLHLETMNDAGIILAWNAGGETSWQVSVAAEGVNMNDGVLLQTPINYMSVENLKYGHWYTAQVRTLCDSDFYGPWSNPIQFYFGDAEDTISCLTPVGLMVESTDVGKVVLSWANNAEATSWHVEVGRADTPLGAGNVMPAPVPFTMRNGLDTATWHWARVQAVCGTDWHSLWSDTVMFYIPGDGNGDNPDNPNDTTQAINLVEQYTYLMPNPARDEVTVASSFRVKAVELYAADGKLLQQVEVNAVGTTLSLEGLPAGIYFVRVRTSAGVTTKRLVVE